MWEKFKWLWITAWRLKKSPYPKISIGAKLCLWPFSLSMLYSAIDVTISFNADFPVDSIRASLQDSSTPFYASFVLMVVGAFLIYSDLKSNLRHTSKVIIASMPRISREFPDEILDSSEKEFCRESVVLGQSVSGGDEHIERQTKFYNAELLVDILNRFVVQEDCKKLYFGGLARIPFLVAYGYMLKNLKCAIIYFDKFHKSSSWQLLDDEDLKVKLDSSEIIEIQPSPSGDVGLAIGFSTRINQEQLPIPLREHTLIVSSNQSIDRNLIKNQENLIRVSNEICKVIDELSHREGCKKVHLFLSVQSTLAIDIGRRYQEGVHKNWVIHNFSPESDSYSWALELSKTGVEYIEASN